MGTITDTSRHPRAPFTPETRLGLPKESAFTRAAKALGGGMSTAFPLDFLPERIMRAYAARNSSRSCRLELRVESDRYVLINTGASRTLTDRLLALEIGDTVTLTEVKVGNIRALASSLLRRSDPRRLSVSETGEGRCSVTRLDLSDEGRRGWSRYQFSDCGPGEKFTVPANQHAGIQSLRSSCSYHGKGRSLVFLARENIDGSITVRCYAHGATPPKWRIDADHARMQEDIERRLSLRPERG